MKKLFLFALAAIFSVGVQAQGTPTVITEQPAGTAVNFKREAGNMFAVVKNKETQKPELTVFDLAKLAENGQGAGDLVMVTAPDGKTVYLKYTLSFATFIKSDKLNSWVKGTKEGNTITIPSEQYLLYGKADDGEYGLQLGYMEVKDGQFAPVEGDIMYTLEGNTLKLEGTYVEHTDEGKARVKILGGYWSDSKQFFCGDALTVFTGDPTGIETIATDNNKQVLGETYYDLSGRRLAKIGNGVTIKNVKYADGTTKSVKVVSYK